MQTRRSFVAVSIWILVFIAAGPDHAKAAATNSAASPPFFRLNQLEQAKAKAKSDNKPIVWIGGVPGHLAPHKNPMGTGSHPATYHAYLAFYRDAVIVLSDCDSENHQEPAIVDRELHSPNAHYSVPGVIVLTPDLDRVIGKVFYIADGRSRTAAYGELVKKIRDKDSWSRTKK